MDLALIFFSFINWKTPKMIMPTNMSNEFNRISVLSLTGNNGVTNFGTHMISGMRIENHVLLHSAILIKIQAAN